MKHVLLDREEETDYGRRIKAVIISTIGRRGNKMQMELKITQVILLAPQRLSTFFLWKNRCEDIET